MTHTNGRTAPELPSYTFENGTTVYIRKISQQTQRDIRDAVMRELPEPKAPIEIIQQPDGSIVQETNTHSEEYAQQLVDWRQQINQRVGEKLMKLASNFSVVDMPNAEEIEVYAQMRHMINVPLDVDLTDKDIWVWHILCSTAEEMAKFTQFVLSISRPTHEEVTRQKATFQD